MSQQMHTSRRPGTLEGRAPLEAGLSHPVDANLLFDPSCRRFVRPHGPVSRPARPGWYGSLVPHYRSEVEVCYHGTVLHLHCYRWALDSVADVTGFYRA